MNWFIRFLTPILMILSETGLIWFSISTDLMASVLELTAQWREMLSIIKNVTFCGKK